jgi:hypothetical protein
MQISPLRLSTLKAHLSSVIEVHSRHAGHVHDLGGGHSTACILCSRNCGLKVTVVAMLIKKPSQ